MFLNLIFIVSVHHDTIYENGQQDATVYDNFLFLGCSTCSSDIFAHHHQEHLNCITASGITHVMANKMQLCRIIYYSLAVLHVSSDIFAHHQEHLNCIYSFWYYIRMLLPVGVMGVLELTFQHSHGTDRLQRMCVIPEAVNTV